MPVTKRVENVKENRLKEICLKRKAVRISLSFRCKKKEKDAGECR